MEINTVAVIGAGAVGAYFIGGLYRKLGKDLMVIAEGERNERLKKHPLIINDRKYTLNVKTPQEAAGADLVLVCVKYGDLEGALPAIKEIVKENTIVMSPMNGVDSEDVIGKEIGMEHMLHSVIRISSERKENSVFFRPEKTQGLYFGEAFDKERTDRIDAVEGLLESTGIHWLIVPDVIREIWFKYSLNICKNLPQAILNVGVGAYEDSEHVKFIMNRLRDEVVAVAAAKGIDISDTAHDAGAQAVVLKSARFSTLQDLDAGRKTEIDMFAGAMVRMGKETGVPVPYNEFCYHAIKALEEKNDGLFDYQ